MARRSARNARVVVTGASSGIGAALAEQLGEKGARLLITARREQRLEEVADSIRRRGGPMRVSGGRRYRRGAS